MQNRFLETTNRKKIINSKIKAIGKPRSAKSVQLLLPIHILKINSNFDKNILNSVFENGLNNK